MDGVNDMETVKCLKDAVDAGAICMGACLGDLGDGEWNLGVHQCLKYLGAGVGEAKVVLFKNAAECVHVAIIALIATKLQ